MTPELVKLLQQLWQQKAAVGPFGNVQYQPKAERALRDLGKARTEVRDLLIVRLDAIGDNFLFFDSYRKLRALFPKTNLVVITYSENKPIYDRCTFVNKTLFVERDALASNKAYREACFKNLRECPQPWDVVFNPLYSREYLAEEIVMATPAHIKLGVAGDNSNLSREVMKMTNVAYTALLPVDSSVTRHELHRNSEILSLLGSGDETIRLEAPLTDEDRAFAANLLKDFYVNRYGVVFPGTKGGTRSIKYWGSENYASLLEQLQLDGGWELMMLLGGQGEEPIASEISALTRAKPHVFQGDLSFWQAAALLERAAFYVGSDTSMAHVATALKVPAFVLLGGGHYGRFFPYPDGFSAMSVSRKLDCFNCDWKCRLTYNKCIADITVANVLSAMAEKNLARLPVEANRAPAPLFSIGSRRSSLPKVDLVLPPGMQTWHLKESWAMILEKAGCLNRVFRPTPETAGQLLNYLRSGGEADFLLALGGDHHLSFLHDTEDKRDAWHRYRAHRVCNSFESTRDSLYKRYVAGVKTALKAFTHFAFTDEVDAPIFEAAQLPALWWPQAADRRLFGNRTDWARRDPRVFFCGKVWSEYPLRKALLQDLQSSQLCQVVALASAGEMVSYYNQHRLAINLPGVLGGFNVRAYEAMSCGCLLLQFQPQHRPANNAMFQHGVHLIYYNYTDAKSLKELIRQVTADPDTFEPIARRGHEEMLAHHTIERRFEQLVDWIFDARVPQYPQYNAAPESFHQARQRRYVNDRYLFEGRPLWNSAALNEFADLQFVRYNEFLPRLCQQGEQLANNQREVEAMFVFKRALELDSDLDLAHNNLGVLCWQRGERRKALDHFAAALADNPRCRPAVINFGEALELAGRPNEAQRLYQDFLGRTPDDGVRALLEAHH